MVRIGRRPAGAVLEPRRLFPEARFAESNRNVCVQTYVGGYPSYDDVLTCLQNVRPELGRRDADETQVRALTTVGYRREARIPRST